MILKTLILKTFAAAILTISMAAGASAATFSFSFDDDPNSNIASRVHLGGSVTGFIYGLEDNTANQTPDAIEFTSDVSGLGMTDTFFDTFTIIAGDGFSISGGVIVAANALLNFNDSTVEGIQLRFNQGSGNNHLIWNGGSGPVVGIGNQGGFAGATYAQVSAVPLPAGGLLLLSAFGGVAALKRRKKRAA